MTAVATMLVVVGALVIFTVYVPSSGARAYWYYLQQATLQENGCTLVHLEAANSAATDVLERIYVIGYGCMWCGLGAIIAWAIQSIRGKL